MLAVWGVIWYQGPMSKLPQSALWLGLSSFLRRNVMENDDAFPSPLRNVKTAQTRDTERERARARRLLSKRKGEN